MDASDVLVECGVVPEVCVGITKVFVISSVDIIDVPEGDVVLTSHTNADDVALILFGEVATT